MFLDDQLFELQKACNRHNDPLAKWVLYAVQRYFDSGRATILFQQRFEEIDPKDFPEIIGKCLNKDRSDDGIIKTLNRIM